MDMNVLVEIPEEDKMFTVSVNTDSKIQDLRAEITQALGLPSDKPVSLSWNGQMLNNSLTFNQAQITKGAKIIVHKQLVGGSELIGS